MMIQFTEDQKQAWMRVISNAIGPDPDVKDGKIYGFEMHGCIWKKRRYFGRSSWFPRTIWI